MFNTYRVISWCFRFIIYLNKTNVFCTNRNVQVLNENDTITLQSRVVLLLFFLYLCNFFYMCIYECYQFKSKELGLVRWYSVCVSKVLVTRLILAWISASIHFFTRRLWVTCSILGSFLSFFFFLPFLDYTLHTNGVLTF